GFSARELSNITFLVKKINEKI
ncbi:transcriptional regulator, partial [Shigella flexneri]|nr:transcriptional regulator [Shigella flexneri]